MDIQHLKYFLEVCKYESFSKAAEHLFVTQPILTRCIKSLEKELGVTLIIRSTKSFSLTDSGRALQYYGQQLVNQHQDIYRHIQDVKDAVVGEVHISSPGVLLDMYFPKVVTDFHRKYPNVRITVKECGSRHTERDVLDGIADIGLIMLPSENPQNLDMIPIVHDSVCVLVRNDHPFARESQIHIRQLAGEDIITYNPGTTLYHSFIKLCQENGFVPRISYQSLMPNFILDIISYGDCVGVLPAPVYHQFKPENLVAIPLIPHFPWEIAMITKKGRYLSHATEKFMKYTLEHL